MAFGDVNLSKDGVREINGQAQSPGAGGWPTVRYFNKDTGYGGAPYPKKTQKKMCDELGDTEYMQLYVEEMGKTSLCQIENTSGCDEKELEFIKKTKEAPDNIAGQLQRLEGMQEQKMKPSLKKWVNKRIAILRQFPTENKEEL